MILIDTEDYVPSGTQFLTGAFYDGDENEFVFTLTVMHDSNTDSRSFDITWVDNTPSRDEEIQEEIIDTFKYLV